MTANNVAQPSLLRVDYGQFLLGARYRRSELSSEPLPHFGCSPNKRKRNLDLALGIPRHRSHDPANGVLDGDIDCRGNRMAIFLDHWATWF